MKTIRVVAAIIHSDDKIFATQRGYGEYKDGWEFPGGKIEAGEAPEAAIKREIREELDTEISVGELIDTIEYDYPDFHLSMDCFWCELVGGAPVLKEHEAARWLDKESLYSVDWLPADVSIIKKIKEKLNGGVDMTEMKTDKRMEREAVRRRRLKKSNVGTLCTMAFTAVAFVAGIFLDYFGFEMKQREKAIERGYRVGHAAPVLTLLLPIGVFIVCTVFFAIKRHFDK